MFQVLEHVKVKILELEHKLHDQESKLNKWKFEFNGKFEEAMGTLESTRKELIVRALADDKVKGI